MSDSKEKVALVSTPEANIEGEEETKKVSIDKENVNREVWGNQIEFLLASIGYSVGVSNVWRFPYLCFKNGGGAFLIPYFILCIFGAIPLYYLEVIIGQYTRSGCIKLWDICPNFRGIGIGITVMCMFVNVYFIIIMVWAMHFMFASFAPLFNEDGLLPWTKCNEWWNTENCRTPGEWANNQSSGIQKVSSTQEYWENRVLGLSKGIEHPEGLQWELVGCLVLSWILVYFCVWKGVKSTGKVVYFTALFPYIMITALLIRGLTLPGAINGLSYYLTPDFSKLMNSQIWLDAGTQVFYSYAVCFGCQIALGSFNKYNNKNVVKDCFINCCFNSGTSLVNGVVIFSVLGYMATEAGVGIEDVAEGGPGLAFVVYPKAVSLMPLAPMWSFAFFFMLVLVGIDSQFVGVEGFVVAITDFMYKKMAVKNKLRECFSLLCCVLSCLAGLSMVTRGGLYMFTLWDAYSATGLALFWFCFWETVALSWGYGADNIYEHIEDMLGRKINGWLKICWKYITPTVILVLFLYCAFTYEKLKLNNYEYPMWAHLMGMSMGIISTVFVPLYFLYSLIIAPGNKVTEKYKNATLSVLPEFPDRKSLPPNQRVIIGLQDISV